MSAVNLDKRYLMVVQTLQYIPGQGIMMLPPKTEKSKRLIKLPEFIKEALRAHFVRRAVLAQNPLWKESRLVFTSDLGNPIFPRNMLTHFKKKLRAIGLPNIRFHDIRHTIATMLFAEKNVHPKLVTELLGHSTVVVTLNRYSHVINPLNTVVSDSLDDLMGSPTGSP